MVLVEIVYVTNDKSLVQISCELPDGSSVRDALAISRLFVSHPEAQGLAVGIFSKLVTADTILKHGDRIELYHPLQYDPKDKRRQRAKLKKSRAQGGSF
jgi:putative ubiquitin-RnfH superfamily antitoxin RatB of RatAB toxin-antitoxin module